jgi:hypothetical protein
MLQVKMIKNWRNFKISYILTLPPVVEIDLQTTTFFVVGISEQLAIRKSTISIYKASSIFDLHMRIFILQGLGAPDEPKKLSTQKLILHLTTAF